MNVHLDAMQLPVSFSYSSWQVRRILKFGMKYAKLSKDYRKPENAEEILKNLNEARIL